MPFYPLFQGDQDDLPILFCRLSKKGGSKLLIEHYGWEYYGGHHHENMFTKFAIANWMKNKFNMDKRIITLSAQVLSGEISRDAALKELQAPPYDPRQMDLDLQFTLKKLGLQRSEFDEYWNRPNKSFLDYPSQHRAIQRLARFIRPF